jgi:hypothetical protein
MSAVPQAGFFDAELTEVRAQMDARDTEMRLERARRFEARKAELRGDTAAWKTGPFAERVDAMLEQLATAGEPAHDMRDAILLGINAAAKQGRLTEDHVSFVEEKARKEVARVSLDGQVVATRWEPRTVASLAEIHPACGQLPHPLQSAAVDKINEVGARLALLGFKSELDVDSSCPQGAQDLARSIREVNTALILVGVARFRNAKGYRTSSEARLDYAESFATGVLALDTRSHPGVAMDLPLTTDGLRQAPEPRVHRDQAAEIVEPRRAEASGHYAGKVVEVTPDRVVQKVGRDPRDLVAHDRRHLSEEPVRVGDVVTIAYEMGLGRLTGPQASKGGPSR